MVNIIRKGSVCIPRFNNSSHFNASQSSNYKVTKILVALNYPIDIAGAVYYLRKFRIRFYYLRHCAISPLIGSRIKKTKIQIFNFFYLPMSLLLLLLLCCSKMILSKSEISISYFMRYFNRDYFTNLNLKELINSIL